MNETKEVRGDSIGTWLIRLMHSYSSANYKKFTELGVHPGQLPVLKGISEKEGINLRTLADTIHIKPPTVTVTVQRLEKAGLVYKQPDADDQRVSRLYLTEKGREVHTELIRLVEENDERMIRGFSPEEIALLRSFLKRMVENLPGDEPPELCLGRRKEL